MKVICSSFSSPINSVNSFLSSETAFKCENYGDCHENRIFFSGNADYTCNYRDSCSHEISFNYTLLSASSTYGCTEGKVGYCTTLIQLNNWKIPDDYPFKVR